MKKIASLVMSFLFVFVTSAQASGSPVTEAIREYKIDTQVRNLDRQASLEKLAANLLESGASKADLIDYVKNNTTEAEFKSFWNIIDRGAVEMEGMSHMNNADFQFVLSRALESQRMEAGANYAGCGAAVGFGIVAMVGAAVLAFMALEANGNFDRNSSDVDIDVNDRDEERAEDYGLAAAIAGTVGVIFTAGGASCK